jgi:hypothetical protein
VEGTLSRLQHTAAIEHKFEAAFMIYMYQMLDRRVMYLDQEHALVSADLPG